tara:strand:+ start:3 stop:866 length:864 start_codon:yes stop_codon:yes gene_type:complete
MKSKKSYIFLSIILVAILLVLLSTIPDKIRSKIGVVNISGTIMESKMIVEQLEDLNKRTDIKGIIIRIDTPGGGVAASQEIYEKVKEISTLNIKPIYASMASTATSGGYYISLGADTIIANKGTITGSIGVIMGYPTIPKLLNEFGITYNTVKSGKYKDAGSLFRDKNKDDEVYFQSVINNMHEQFVDVLSKERRIDILQANQFANGKVYTGLQAKDLNLIDLIGTFDYSVKLMSQELNYENKLELFYIEQENDGFLNLFNTFYDFLNPNKNELFPIPQFSLYYGAN